MMTRDALRKMISWSTRVVIGKEFKIDAQLPISYLFSESVRRAVMLLFGVLRFYKLGVMLSPSARIRCRSRIFVKGSLVLEDNAVINALSENGIEFGNGVSIGKSACIECTGTIRDLGKGLRLGDGVGVGSFSFLGCAGGVEIGSDTILGNFVSLHSENHVFSDVSVPIRDQGVIRAGIKIGKGCWIGAKATILDGVTIGDNCVIAAGAVVVAGVYPNYVVLGGVPARVIKEIKPSC